jgi:hypothetical protein
VVEGGAQFEEEIMGSRPLFREVFGFWNYVTSMGMLAHGFTHARDIL